MKKLGLTISIVGAMIFAIAVSAAAPANFAGTWTLDKGKSKGLDGRMQNAESVQWVIAQDDKQITIESKITGGQNMGGGDRPGGGGGRGMGGPRTYSLDGKETTTEAQGGTSTMKATWSSDGQTLELQSVRAGNFNGNDFKATTNDKLQLSSDSKVLTVKRTGESPRGPVDATLVFTK
ncbi:MAG: hypothetical protein M3R68_08070 [Acidobacteriota bacterium]|nr:hypothetical protein [Acidobacteriota bacterium]